VIMPNHMHGLVLLPTDLPELPLKRAASLSTIIGNFKAAVSRQTSATQLWQRGFMDRVVRNRDEFERIREYILLNPERWAGDRYNPAANQTDDDFLLSEEAS